MSGNWHDCPVCGKQTDGDCCVGEIERLRAIVDKLPKTADGVPLTGEYMTVWHIDAISKRAKSTQARLVFHGPTNGVWEVLVGGLYSTRAAAEAAEEKA
jgi:hypothetical protein